MNKLYLTLIIGILLISIVGAGITLSNISLSTSAEATLKAELPINKVATINPTITDITCDKTTCRSWISYPNLINTEWINDKSYCSKTSKLILDENNQTIGGGDCIAYTDYTIPELEVMRKAWIENRLESFTGYLEDRKEVSIKE
jgi:hypothetical protein